MRYASLLVVLAMGAAAPDSAVKPFQMSLKDDKVGEMPNGWVAEKTGDGPGNVWKVVEDSTAPGRKVLAQTSPEGPNPLFNLCVAKDTSFQDVDIELALKAVAGKKDQGGGPIWRYKDSKNYYVARLNPLEDNYRAYKVVDGKRTQLGTADVKAPAGKWHRLRVVHQGDHIQCFLDGKPMLDVHDSTFSAAGKTGLWTKADAVTHFDDLRVRRDAPK